MINRKKIYSTLLRVLGNGTMSRGELISKAAAEISGLCPGKECPVGPTTELRGALGSAISDMEAGGVLSHEEDGRLRLASSKPIALRAESCEKEILAHLTVSPMTKREIREALVKHFGTDKTLSTRDDEILYTLIGQVTKRLLGYGVILLDGGKYMIAPEKAARLDDINEYARLKSELISRIHAKGGEFFEHYILTLLSKHFERTGKRIVECYVTGGSADGGIDGIIKTEDALGFREHLMIQAKNRLELTTETAVRSFWGAVCAAQGSRGIFATTSDFHQSAAKFLSGIDNCVGVNADTIVRLACECEYGVKKHQGKYTIDKKIF